MKKTQITAENDEFEENCRSSPPIFSVLADHQKAAEPPFYFFIMEAPIQIPAGNSRFDPQNLFFKRIRS